MDKNIKVLMVDDETDFRTLMTYWLESKGYTVLTAGDGKSAIEIAKNETPDILLLDLHMPSMTGAEVLKEIREFNKDIPAIVISAHANSAEAKEAVGYGISGVFNKSKNFDEALSLLESALRTHKKLKK